MMQLSTSCDGYAKQWCRNYTPWTQSFPLEIVDAAIQEDVQGIAITSYSGRAQMSF